MPFKTEIPDAVTSSPRLAPSKVTLTPPTSFEPTTTQLAMSEQLTCPRSRFLPGVPTGVDHVLPSNDRATMSPPDSAGSEPTAAQNVGETQDRLRNALIESIGVAADHVVPFHSWYDARPLSSYVVAMQKVGDGHDTSA